MGITGIAGFNGFVYLGLHHTSAAKALLLQAAVPAGVLLADQLIFRVSAPVGRVAGVAFSTIGVILIVMKADVAVLAGFTSALAIC